MIAAHSLAARAVLVTNNERHYERIAGLVLAKTTDPRPTTHDKRATKWKLYA